MFWPRFIPGTWEIQVQCVTAVNYLLDKLNNHQELYSEIINYLPNSMEHGPAWKLTILQLVTKFPTFYGTQSSSLHSQQPSTCSYPKQDQSNPFPFNWCKIYFNIILPSMPRSSKWSLAFRFPHQNPACMSPLPHICHMPHPPHCEEILLKLIPLIRPNTFFNCTFNQRFSPPPNESLLCRGGAGGLGHAAGVHCGVNEKELPKLWCKLPSQGLCGAGGAVSWTVPHGYWAPSSSIQSSPG